MRLAEIRVPVSISHLNIPVSEIAPEEFVQRSPSLSKVQLLVKPGALRYDLPHTGPNLRIQILGIQVELNSLQQSRKEELGLMMASRQSLREGV